MSWIDENNEHEGYLAYDDTTPAKRPAVLIFHQWAGCGAFEQSKARMLAELGYVGFAVDMYGAGKRGSNPQENSALMTPCAAMLATAPLMLITFSAEKPSRI